MDIGADSRNRLNLASGASSWQKRTAPIQATISDDRSRGSEFEAKGHILRALKGPIANKESEIEEDEPTEYVLRKLPQPTIVSEHEYADTQPNSFNAFEDQNDPLDKVLHLISRTLNERDTPALTMETLQAYILDLKSKREEEPAYPRVQLVYRVLRQIDDQIITNMYLDQPMWLEGETSSREALAGNLPLSNLSSYLSKHPSVCCIFNRDYDITLLKRMDTPDEDWIEQDNLRPTAETVTLVTVELTTAVAKFFDYYDLKREYITTWIELPVPYIAIYHARGDVSKFLQILTHEQRIQFQALLDHIMSQYQNEYDLVDDMARRGTITQGYIKYLFKPGDMIVQGHKQNARGYLSVSWLSFSQYESFGEKEDCIGSTGRPGQASTKENAKRAFVMTTWSWDYDGEFSKQESELILQFDAQDHSEKNIVDLSIRPLRYVDEQTKTRLKTRGEWFWKCRERRMVSYDDALQGIHNSSNERYMVDMMLYRELHKPDLSKTTPTKGPDVNYLSPEAMKQEHPPEENFLYLAPFTVKAYNLKRKKWVDLQLDGLCEISWNTRAFESLVLNKKTKRLIQALISNQIEAEKSTDLISGKGNGLIMLLHGGPGTGKTLTAESVAEIAKKPLYPVTCGDIGTKPEDVERYLESVLYLGKTWGCVVLLDEADVFLEQRSLEDLQRNALVSVFLRVLEYYDGILILTSNRVGTFDEAFKSRIQLAVHYNSLTTHQRTKIWENFIERLRELNEEGIDFDDLEDNIEQLAKREMNGREIRNAITTARQYARWERQQDQGKQIIFCHL